MDALETPRTPAKSMDLCHELQALSGGGFKSALHHVNATLHDLDQKPHDMWLVQLSCDILDPVLPAFSWSSGMWLDTWCSWCQSLLVLVWVLWRSVALTEHHWTKFACYSISQKYSPNLRTCGWYSLTEGDVNRARMPLG